MKALFLILIVAVAAVPVVWGLSLLSDLIQAGVTLMELFLRSTDHG